MKIINLKCVKETHLARSGLDEHVVQISTIHAVGDNNCPLHQVFIGVVFMAISRRWIFKRVTITMWCHGNRQFIIFIYFFLLHFKRTSTFQFFVYFSFWFSMKCSVIQSCSFIEWILLMNRKLSVRTVLIQVKIESMKLTFCRRSEFLEWDFLLLSSNGKIKCD